jgi:hypothetical protein
MVTLAERGELALIRRMKQAAGFSVTYTRRDKKGQNPRTCDDLTVWLGNTTFTGLMESNISVQRGERDYLLAAADLVLEPDSTNPEPTTPQRGDRIVEADGTEWEVASPAAEEPVWRYSDHYGHCIRVHTRQVIPLP